MTEFDKRLACVIKADGGIARGYPIDTCKRVGMNEYIITWKIPLQGEAKTNVAGTVGSCAVDEKVEPGFITVGLTSDPKQCGCRHTMSRENLTPARFILRHSGINRLRRQGQRLFGSGADAAQPLTLPGEIFKGDSYFPASAVKGPTTAMF